MMVASSARASDQPSTASDVRLRNRQFVVGGQPFLVKGIHYGPWRAGTGPNKGYPYPPLEGIAADFETIRGTHANTVLIYDAPPEVLDLAERDGLKVVYCFALDWYAVGGPEQASITAKVVARVNALRGKPALLAWLLGNEVGSHALTTRGADTITAGLRDLYVAVKAADPHRPVSHANWPPARFLNLDFLDFLSFNVYPLWPPEVAAQGFGPFIQRALVPLARDKPLLISEFGANTIEAGEDGQARLLRSSWDGLVKAGAAGGIVFEFADEWWKNYDNPTHPGDWWTRSPAPDDEKQADNDPEETYGLVTSDRQPKPALAVVSAMYGTVDGLTRARTFGATALAVLLLTAVAAWALGRRRARGSLDAGRSAASR